MRQMLRTSPAAPAELAEGKWGRGGVSQKHLIQDGPWLCELESAPGVAQVEGQMKTGLTDTLEMSKKRNTKMG